MSILKRLFGGGRPDNTQAKLDAIFEKLEEILTDDARQNAMLPEELRYLLEAGPSVDQLPGGTGEFGRSMANPIPVNGPVGEVAYLSSLRAEDGRLVFAHRVGSRSSIDIFETVTSDGKDWDLLYFSLYHPRRSRRLPKGYRSRGSDSPPLIFATTAFVPDFPRQMNHAVSHWTKSTLGIPLVSPEIRRAVENQSFLRSPGHAAQISTLQIDGKLEVGPHEKARLLKEHVDGMQKALSAVLEQRVTCGPFDPIEMCFFCGSIATYAYIRFGRTEPDRRMLDEFSSGLVADSVKRSLGFSDSAEQYQLRYREYCALFDGVFEEDSDQRHMFVTVLMHAVERMTGKVAKGHMIEISICAPVVAALFQDSIELARDKPRYDAGR